MRYFFHRIDGGQDIDHDGIELINVDEAKYEAILFAADTLKDDRYAMLQGGEMLIETTNADHAIVFTVVITTVIPPQPETE